MSTRWTINQDLVRKFEEERSQNPAFRVMDEWVEQRSKELWRVEGDIQTIATHLGLWIHKTHWFLAVCDDMTGLNHVFASRQPDPLDRAAEVRAFLWGEFFDSLGKPNPPAAGPESTQNQHKK